MIMLFMEGLAEPLRGWVRAYKPISLTDVISRTRDMIEAVPKTRAFAPTRPTAPQGNRDTRPPQRDGGCGQMDEETWRDLKRRRLCFMWQEPWELEHKCTKGKAHFIEVYSYSEPDEESKMGEDKGDEGEQ